MADLLGTPWFFFVKPAGDPKGLNWEIFWGLHGSSLRNLLGTRRFLLGRSSADSMVLFVNLLGIPEVLQETFRGPGAGKTGSSSSSNGGSGNGSSSSNGGSGNGSSSSNGGSGNGSSSSNGGSGNGSSST